VFEGVTVCDGVWLGIKVDVVDGVWLGVVVKEGV